MADFPFDISGNSRTRRIGFQASVLTAVAAVPVRNDHHVSDFPTDKISPFNKFIIHDDSTAHARTYRQVQNMLFPATLAEYFFCHDRGIAIVDHPYGQSKFTLKNMS